MADTKSSFLLTTTDNPYNPHTHYEQWYNFDLIKGYDTCGLLARLSHNPTDLDDGTVEDAMAKVVKYNWSGKHIMVSKDEFTSLIKIE